LKVEHWADKMETSAAVFNYVNRTLFEVLPYPTYKTDDVDLKTNLVYEHLKHQYVRVAGQRIFIIVLDFQKL
jgi:type I restriction enzyme R subunit